MARITAIWPYRGEIISILLLGFTGTLIESKIQIFDPPGGLLFGGKTPARAYGWKSRTMDGNFYVSGGYSSGRRHVVRVHKKPQANWEQLSYRALASDAALAANIPVIFSTVYNKILRYICRNWVEERFWETPALSSFLLSGNKQEDLLDNFEILGHPEIGFRGKNPFCPKRDANTFFPGKFASPLRKWWRR